MSDYNVSPLTTKTGSWLTVKCAGEKAYKELHAKIDDIEHICNKSELTLYINCVELFNLLLK